MKVYLVWSGEYSDKTVEAVFSTREKAEKYAEVHDALYDFLGIGHYVEERELDKNEVPEGTRVVKYYRSPKMYVKDYDDGYFSFKAGEMDHEFEDTSAEIYTSDVVEVVDDDGNWIQIWSTKSAEHAQKVLIEKYQKITQQELANQGCI